MLKKLGYVLLIFSYISVAFILVYANLINPQCNEKVFLILTILVVMIWLFVPILFSKASNTETYSQFTLILKFIATLPLYLLFLPFAFIGSIVDIVTNSFRIKVRALLKNGFACKTEKTQKRKTYFLSRENIVIKISEFDVYEVSEDAGITFECIENSKSFSAKQREAFKENLTKYHTCDYRDRALYDPTRILVEMVIKQ